LDFGSFFPCNFAPHTAHLAADGFFFPRLITVRPDGMRFFIFFAFLTIQTPLPLNQT